MRWHFGVFPTPRRLHINNRCPACASETAEPTRRECPEIKPLTPAASARALMIRLALVGVNRSLVTLSPRRIRRNNAPRSIPAFDLPSTTCLPFTPNACQRPLCDLTDDIYAGFACSPFDRSSESTTAGKTIRSRLRDSE